MLYRKHKQYTDTEWHYCRECPRWPRTDAVETNFVDPENGDTICSDCTKLKTSSGKENVNKPTDLL